MTDDEKPLTGEQFNRLRSYQDSGCALCGKKRNDLVLDHDHKSMLIRGLLCSDCNLLLGEYERKKRLYAHYEAYLQEPPCAVLGLNVAYKPAAKARKESA